MMNFRVVGGLLAGASLLFLSGCSFLRLSDNDVPAPPPVQRQARLLQVPDDLRLPREPVLRSVFPANVVPLVASIPTPPAPVTIAPVPGLSAVSQSNRMLFAPYVPTSKESLPPQSWEVDPKHDFPWIAGAQPARVNEETTVGVGARMFGRLFAQVEFGSAGASQAVNPPALAEPPAATVAKTGNFISRWFRSDADQKTVLAMPVLKPPMSLPHASRVTCASTTCLDAARDMLIQDSQAKGWKTLLNRRVSFHQSFQFQREDRVIWVEVTSTGKNVLQLEYSLLPVQETVTR